MSITVPPDSTGKQVETVTPTVGQHRQLVALGDPISSANQATVAQFHNADNQNPGGTAYGLLTGGVAQLLNTSGNIDRQRETGVDSISAVGVATGSAQFAMQFLTTDSTDNFAAGTRTFTPVLMSGTLQGVAWSIQVGSVLSLDSGANQENVVVTAVTATTFTCVTAKAHNGTVTPFAVSGFVYNQERDCSGELDGASGSGTAVAAEYEYNGGGGGTASSFNSQQNFDRARNLQGKGLAAPVAISSGGGIASTSVVLGSAPNGLQPGQPLFFLTGATVASGISEVQYVAKNYVVGSTTVPLQTGLIVNHGTNSVVWDTYAPSGPGLNGFMPTGIGIEEEALYDPVSGAFYIERSATQDGVSAQNVVMENPSFYNGATADRGYNNWRQTAITSTLYNSATTTSSADLTNFNARGIVIGFDVTAWTAGGTSTTVNVQGKFGSDYITLYSFSLGVIGAAGALATAVYPGASSAAAWSVAPLQGVIPRTFRLQVVTVGSVNYTATLYVDEMV